MKLNLYILILGYLRDRLSYLTKRIKDKNENRKKQDKEPQVSSSKEKKNKKKFL